MHAHIVERKWSSKVNIERSVAYNTYPHRLCVTPITDHRTWIKANKCLLCKQVAVICVQWFSQCGRGRDRTAKFKTELFRVLFLSAPENVTELGGGHSSPDSCLNYSANPRPCTSMIKANEGQFPKQCELAHHDCWRWSIHHISLGFSRSWISENQHRTIIFWLTCYRDIEALCTINKIRTTISLLNPEPNNHNAYFHRNRPAPPVLWAGENQWCLHVCLSVYLSVWEHLSGPPSWFDYFLVWGYALRWWTQIIYRHVCWGWAPPCTTSQCLCWNAIKIWRCLNFNCFS